MLKIDISKILVCAYEAQTKGKYAATLDELKFFWDYEQPYQEPVTDGLNQNEIADLLLACGLLYGFYGTRKKDAQEISKNFLTRAYEIYIKTGQIEKQLMCCNYHAAAYWRMGDNEEARAWLTQSFSYNIVYTHPAKLYAYILESLVNLSAEEYKVALARLNFIKDCFDSSDDLYLRALFYMNSAVAKKKLVELDGALSDNKTACELFRRIGHRHFYCYLLNNIACVYLLKSEYQAAMQYASRSLEIALKIQDIRQVAGIYDTLALATFGLGRSDTALWLSNRATMEILKTEAYYYYAEYYGTKIDLLLKLDRFSEALDVYVKVLAVTGGHLAEKERNNLTDKLNQYKANKVAAIVSKKPKLPKKAGLLFDRLPFAPVRCVRVIRDDYSYEGFDAGNLIVIEEANPQNGDFAAVVDKENNYCHFGSITTFLELVQLETCIKSEPLVFHKDNCSILGRVYGYCKPEPDEDGNFRVISFNKEKV